MPDSYSKTVEQTRATTTTTTTTTTTKKKRKKRKKKQAITNVRKDTSCNNPNAHNVLQGYIRLLFMKNKKCST